MRKRHNFLGLEWIAGESGPLYLDPLPGPGEPYYAVSSVQLQAFLGMLELALEAKSEAISAIDPSSWLVGFEAGSEAMKRHLSANSGPRDAKSHAPRQPEDKVLNIQGQYGTGHVRPLRSTSSESVEKAFSETSDSSSEEVGGSTGEVATPPCMRIVIEHDRIEDLSVNADGIVVTLKNGVGQ